MTDFIDELMDLNPAQVITAFQEQTTKSSGNPNIYKTNPLSTNKDVSPDGHYRSKVRILYNPFDKSQSIVKSAHYSFNDADGFFMLDTKLALGDRNCRIFKDWKSLHFDNNPEIVATVDMKGIPTQVNRKQWGDYMFDKTELQYCLIQIIEDDNQPELVGKIMAWKLPKAVFDMLNAKMNPTDKRETPIDIMNYVFGPALKIDVTPGPDDPEHPERKQREIKYSLCSFETESTPIIKITGESFFNDDELDMINDYAEGKRVLTNAKSTAKKKEDATNKCKALVPALKELMQRAMDYIKENAINLNDEVGYKEPNESQWERYSKWIAIVRQFQNPMTHVESNMITETKTVESIEATESEGVVDEGEDLPF